MSVADTIDANIVKEYQLEVFIPSWQQLQVHVLAESYYYIINSENYSHVKIIYAMNRNKGYLIAKGDQRLFSVKTANYVRREPLVTHQNKMFF